MSRSGKITVLALALALLFGALCPRAAADDAEPAIVDPFRLYTYEQMNADLAALAARYPELITVGSIGQSVDGREIPVFRLGRGHREILICAAMHAREYETTNFVMYMAEQYCRGYASGGLIGGYDCRVMLDEVRFIVVPMLNPDGVAIAQLGPELVATRPDIAAIPVTDGWPGNYHCWKANARGVDLNRNWDYCFNNTYKQKKPSSADYAGPEPMSEPETRAMAALVDSTPFYAFCSFHSAGNVVYWTDATNSKELKDKLRPTAAHVADALGYALMAGASDNRSGGCMINTYRAKYERPCITVEIGPYTGKYPFPDYERFRSVVERALPVGFVLADEVLQMPAQEQAIDVTLDGVSVLFPDVRPVIRSDRTLTPLRAVCEAAGLSVGWEDGVVTVTDGARSVSLRIGQPEISVDGEVFPLDCAPVIVNDRTLIPIRALMEAFGMTVFWDGGTRSVHILRAAEVPDGDAETESTGEAPEAETEAPGTGPEESGGEPEAPGDAPPSE